MEPFIYPAIKVLAQCLDFSCNLLKVHNETIGNKEKNVVQKAKTEHKKELLFKKEDIQSKI